MGTETISVIIPAYNGSPFIERALKSILRQTHAATEIVVIDDGSTDDTAEVVARFGQGVKYFAKPNGGLVSTRNEGIRRVNSDFIALLDQDDWWPDDMLEKTLGYFQQNPHWQVVHGQSKVEFEPGANRDAFKLPEAQLTAHFPLVSAALFRRSAFERVGLFDGDLPIANDLDWFNRARESDLPLLAIPDLTLHYRWHANNTTKDTQRLRTQMMMALKLSLARRRQQPAVKPLPSFESLGGKS